MAHEPRLLEHEYDGISEYDNPTPGWWHALFFVFVLLAPFYMLISLASPIYKTPAERHESEQLAHTRTLFGALGELEPTDATIVRYYADQGEDYAERWMPYAESVFRANCASCHGSSGEGAVGPNLTDDAFLNITTLADIHTVIRDGANGNAMPAWGSRFHPNEIVLLTSYVASLRGQELSGRAPEGEPAPPWPTLEEVGGEAETSDSEDASAG